mmetsp:Transcript_9664/g.13809  ORF Transcript_9664/g.13809 Transcript_9664/m.13809 type:complete len:480 (-) Transcript_9664:711-2150(-)|eukprot:CAMPEP_0201698336 /NCGR_PEP_ID=MMETSP0578-20130828/18514_1 /ASSEMBLY_ACC=CAM_ASM_000663 /TAXON_ID=267565 /ORGANISM="Skeletonema grethea, Strain CCMP 1804" /LENGTH=479 /DNA_ID=CAMNT_0048184839 /DNA_START=103 /DNA_END=1542 /DNA_ORIENTATION=-
MSQAEFKRRLKALMLKPENQVCSDCPERQPRWASLIVPPPGAPAGSLPMGAFCCLECSGSHRRLGVHISFVRSVNLDQWKEKEVLAMENGGNAKVNAIFEAHLNVNKPNNSASGPVRERFIRDKYERRKFYDPRAFESAAQMSNGGGQEEEEVIAGVQRRLASQRSNRAPSDAARRRVEERAARNRSGGKVSSSSSSTRTKPVKAPVPMPVAAPEPVADLLDFGDFTSTEAATSFSQTNASSAPVVAAAPPAAAPPAPPAAVDMFANMTSPIQNAAPAAPQQQQQQQQQPEKKPMSNADIMSMFSTPSTQHNSMQQNMFPMQMAGGMGGGNNMGMVNMNNNNMGMMNQQQMGMNNNMNNMGMNNMGNMGMGGNMNQRMAMQNGMGQNGMGQMNQQQNGMGMNNMMGNNMNQMAMMQQQQLQQNQMQQMNMMGGNNMMMQGGGMMQGGNQFGSPMGQAQQKRGGSGSTANQFADFGNFGR